ncbi:MAG: DNA alkylation repair protein [Patescibacteria group bacterium]|jgi:3-methyladenine DNA glycosylase AlkD
MSDLPKLIKEIKSHENKLQASILQRFFKTGPSQYGEGDLFLGLKVPLQRLLARKYAYLSLKDVETLLASKIHEFRLVGLLILVDKYEKAGNRGDKKKIVDFYLDQVNRVNNWDLVDLSVYKILGDFLLAEKNALQVLKRLAGSRNLWERRMAMVATYAFIKKGQAEKTILIAERLIKDEHDLMHKAVGWMLREMGKRIDKKILTDFLDKHYRRLPRTALRYAIERLSPRERDRYLAK